MTKPREIPFGVSGDQLGADGNFRPSYRCAECGEQGHNRATCPKVRARREKAGAIPPKSKPTKRPEMTYEQIEQALKQRIADMKDEISEMERLLAQMRFGKIEAEGALR